MVRTNDAGSTNPEIRVGAEIVLEARSAAKANWGEFKAVEQAWARAHCPTAQDAIDAFFTQETRGARRPDFADQALQGAILGCGIVHRLVEIDEVSLATVRGNHDSNIRGKALDYPGDLSTHEIRRWFGDSTGSAIDTIAYPVARTLCAATLILSLSSGQPVQKINFTKPVQAKPVARPRPKRSAYGGGGRR